MIKRFLFIFFAVAGLVCNLTISVQAQTGILLNKERSFFGGLVFGANMSTVQGDNHSGYSKVGLNVGPTVYVRLAKSIFANIEFLYTQKGSRGVNEVQNIYTGSSFERYYLDLNYVELPLVFNYLMNDRWHIGVGGSYALLLGSKEEAVSYVQPIYIRNEDHPFNKSDINFIVGGGYELGKGLFITARYQQSISTVREPSLVPLGYGEGDNQYNSLFSIRVMYLIH